MGIRISSRTVLVFCFIIIFLTGFVYYPKWKMPATEATISWDVSGYYMYLPAIFIYHDIQHCSFKDTVINKYHPTPNFQQAFLHPSGNYIMKYSCGQALMYSPFFFLAHGYAFWTGNYAADGFPAPYQLAISIGMLLYCFLGLFVLRKVLKEFFPDSVVAFVLLTLVLGSNYLNYAAIDGAMTHNTLFTIYSLILFYCIKFYKSPNIVNAAAIGLLTGLATLTRPTEMISILLPLLWNINSVRDLRERFRFLFKNYQFIITGVFCFLIVSSLQLIYWKLVSSHWLVYSYQNESFDWFHPHFKNWLISYRSGWITYSPVMVLSLLGFIFMYRYKKFLFWPLATFSLLFMYLCFAWQTWWYGGSLGQRAMVQCYPVLAFPMACFFLWISKQGRALRMTTMAFIILCMLYNIWLTHQGHRGGLFRAGEMNRAYFWATIGRNRVNEDVFTLLDNKELYRGRVKNERLVYQNEFESNPEMNGGSGKSIRDTALFLNASQQQSREYFFSFPEGRETWIRASADFNATQKEWDVWKMPQFILRFYYAGQEEKTNMIRVFRVLGDWESKNLHVDARLPDKVDSVSVQFWNAGSDKQIGIDNLKVVVF